MAAKVERFVYVTYIRTTAAKLWRALTSGEMTRQYWFQTRLEGKPKKGSQLRFVLPDGKPAIVGRVLEAKAGKKLSYEFRTVGWHDREPASRVTCEIAREAGVMRLTVIHDKLGRSPGMAKDISGGWPMILSALKTLLESGKSLWRKQG